MARSLRPSPGGGLAAASTHVQLLDAVAHDGEEAEEHGRAHALRLQRLRQLVEVHCRAILCKGDASRAAVEWHKRRVDGLFGPMRSAAQAGHTVC